jgi:lipoprotein-anchoring transpeptidase ErfK/SrfK
MFRTIPLALLAGASTLLSLQPASAIEGPGRAEPTVVYADQMPQPPAPVRTAYAERSSMGGGFLEFLFSDGQSGRRPPPQAYDARRGMLPPMDPQQDYAEPARPALDPKYEKQVVEYHGKEGSGTIVIDTPNKFLFLVQGDGRALRYGIGVGRPGFTWSGVKTISAKKEWPAWTPPPEMLARRPDLPRHMEGGPQNPLGARAMYLGSSLYRIHGSNEPWTIGTNVSSGCIRMRNEDVIDLYGRVNVGAKVVVL